MNVHDLRQALMQFVDETHVVVRFKTDAEALMLVDYVYGRPLGEIPQEVGGVMVTLAALCMALELDMENLGHVEVDRIWQKIDQIRAKQAAKPRHSPLPGPS